MNSLQRRTRVLFLQEIIFPYRRPLFEALSRQLDLTVYFCKRSKKFRRWDFSGFASSTFRAEVLKHIPVGPLVLDYTLPAKLLREPYDVYIVGAIDLITLPQILVIFAVAKAKRRPVILCDEFIETAWYAQRYPIKKAFNNRLRAILYNHFDAFIAWNSKAATYMLKRGVPEGKIFLGPHYYPREYLSQPTKEKKASPFGGKRVVLTLSYLLEHKGFDCLIRAFKALKHKDAVLVIAGAGESERRLKALAGDDDRIIFTGYVEGVAKANCFALADVFVLPTLHDSWGLVVNEAMYFGLPVIVTDAAGCSDHLIKDNGFIVRAGDEEGLRNALEILLADDDLRRKMGEKSKMYIRECDLHAMMQPVLDAVDYVTRERKTNHAQSSQGV